ERVFLPGLALALLRQRVLRLPARPGLHRRLGLAGLLGGLLGGLLRGLLLRVLRIDVALDGALLRRRLLRLSARAGFPGGHRRLLPDGGAGTLAGAASTVRDTGFTVVSQAVHGRRRSIGGNGPRRTEPCRTSE